MQNILLNGTWKCFGTNENNEPLSFEVSVPGTVHTGMIENGLIQDIFYGQNADKYMWIEDKNWTFTKEFQFSLNSDTKKAELEFLGLDTYCEVFLNDNKLGFCDNMNLSYTYDVLPFLKDGKNVIRIEFLSPKEQVKDIDFGICDGAFARDRMFTRRMQCTYGWDWVHRLITMGIWRDVTLFINRFSKIDCLCANLKSLTPFGADMEISLFGTHDFKFFNSAFSEYLPHEAVSPMVEFKVFDPDGRVIYNNKRLFRESFMAEYFTVENPKLWYPNGYGESPLYSLCAVVTDENGTVLCEKTVSFGIREFSIIEKADSKDSKNYKLAEKQFSEFIKTKAQDGEFASFETIVNNTKVFCRGGNWVPADPFPGNVSSARLEELIRLAHDAGINMLRIWGGGYFESDEFYDLCDKYGIMIQQDFLMACGTYPYDDELLEQHNEDALHFTESFKAECEQNLKRLVSHPSIVWYNGDNENMMPVNENYVNNARRIAYEITLPAIRKYDRNRRFFVSSPWGGSHFNSPAKGMFHATGFLDFYLSYIKNKPMDDYVNYFGNAVSRFANETPVMSSISVCSLKKFIPEEEMGIDKFSCFDYHTKNHPAKEYKDFHLFDHIDRGAKKIFGEFKSASDRLFKMNLLGYEWTRSVMESYRRNLDFTSGNLFWMFNDCWPAIGWSMIDFYLVPKTAYYAMKRTCKKISSSIIKENGKIKVFVSNCSNSDTTVSGTVYFSNSDKIKNSISFEFLSTAGKSEEAFSFEYTDCVAVVCDIEGGGISDRSVYLDVPPAKTKLEPSNIALKKDADKIELKSDKLSLFVTLDGEFIFSDNAFLMLPGETKTIAYEKTLYASSDELQVFSL